jgi:hypothetical protein
VLLVESLVPGMSALNSGAVARNDRILAIDAESFDLPPTAPGGR